jgi:arylsulfatase A-like enzyme
MRLRLFLPLFLLTLVAVVHARAAERPPNVILILADDMGYADVGFNGRTEWGTPNLDRLASQGTIFHRWYTASVVCAPSRAALMTGKYGIHNGCTRNSDDLPKSEITLSEALKPRGYVSALVGKWHHGAPRPPDKTYVHPLDHGFDEFTGYTDAGEAWEHFPTSMWFGREKKPVQGNAETLFTDHSIDFIRRHRDRPFFLYLAHVAPHFKIEAPAEDVAQFRGKFPEKDPAKPVNATYAAMVSHLDAEIGRFLRALDELGLSENTLVVFSSDHGATFENGNGGASSFHDSNRPFRGGKRSVNEGGIRVPGVVRWPGRVPAGRTSEELIHNIDVLPTFLAAAGGTPDPGWKLDGVDVLPVWQGSAKAPDRTLFWEWRTEGRNQLAAMRGDMKLVILPGNPPELYDVVKDPAERRNVFEEFDPVTRELRARLESWLATETEEAKSDAAQPKKKRKRRR